MLLYKLYSFEIDYSLRPLNWATNELRCVNFYSDQTGVAYPAELCFGSLGGTTGEVDVVAAEW